ncbi:unnamed protein product [Allacma fusca]|uniref:Uncharacterized protein n=1 Tax=Allacma fusca TaxID=39272 RepID=A0A8J2L3Z3_9HEXA|nr:unnamed protein product [Allacma fusca]
MENIRNSAIGKAAKSIRTSFNANADDEYFKRISSFKKHYEEKETETVREFARKYSTDFPEHRVSPKLLRPAVESLNMDGLYVQVLKSLEPTIQSEEQSDCESDSLASYLKKAFHKCPESHGRLETLAQGKQSSYVLNVEVVKAKDLTGKDANGLSDPFCAVYISPEMKHYTLIQDATLNPVWTEHFSFPIGSIQDDVLHLEVWDYDPPESLLEKVRRISEVNSTRGLRNLFTEVAVFAAAAGKQRNQFLASLQIPIKDIPAEGYEKWFYLDSTNNRKGEIFVRMIVGAKKNKQVIVKEYRHVMYLIMACELAEREDRQYSWDGEFSPHAQFVLNQLKLQGGLLPCDVVLAQWQVYTRVHCEVPLDTKLFPRLLNKILEHLEHEDFGSNEIELFWRSCEILLENFTSFVFNNYQYFLTESTAISQMQQMIRTLLILETYLSKKPENNAVITTAIITEKITSAISIGAETMFGVIKMGSESGRNDIVVAIKIGQQLIADLKSRFEFLDEDFKELLEIQYSEIAYRVYDKKFRELVEPLALKYCAKFKPLEDKNENRLSQDMTIRNNGANLLELYLALKHFASIATTLKSQDNLSIQGSFQSWFSPAVIYWLDVASQEAESQIYKDVQHDNLTPVTDVNFDNRCFITSSAAEIQLIFERILDFWNHLSVPEMAKTLVFTSKIIEDISKLVVNYAKKIIKRAEQLEKNRLKTCLLSHEICFAITDIEFVIHELTSTHKKLETDIVAQLGTLTVPTIEFQQTLKIAINNSQDRAKKKADKIMGKVVSRQVELYINRLLTDDLETGSDKGSETYDCLHDNLKKLMKTQSTNTFDKLLVMIWENVSKGLKNIADRNIKLQKNRAMIYVGRIEKMLEVLTALFFPTGTAESDVRHKYHNPDIQEVLNLISLHKSPTNDLIIKYIQKRVQQQDESDVCTANHGILVFRTAYFEDEGMFRVEINSCKDLKAADMNGLSDPYVKLTIVPPEQYPKVNKKTKVKEKTLCPVFEETFSIPLTPEQMVSHGVLNFSVKDYDRMSKNDFLGEAYLSLESTRLFQQLRSASTVKLTDLPLIHLALSTPDSQMSQILEVLEIRQDDQQALNFAKKERAKQAEFEEKKPSFTRILSK